MDSYIQDNIQRLHWLGYKKIVMKEVNRVTSFSAAFKSKNLYLIVKLVSEKVQCSELVLSITA